MIYCAQRAGIADGGELAFRPPGTTADKSYFDKVKIKCLALFFPLELKIGFLLLLIILPSSPTIGNTRVSCSHFDQKSLYFFTFLISQENHPIRY